MGGCGKVQKKRMGYKNYTKLNSATLHSFYVAHKRLRTAFHGLDELNSKKDCRRQYSISSSFM
jgi:hypothetical protein